MRALRTRLDLTQQRAGARVRISDSQVSRIEHGRVGRIPFATLQQYGQALGADVELNVRWRGEGVDRLVDEAHARIVGVVVALLRGFGWEVAVEVSFAIAGERGSIDVFAWHPLIQVVIVVEVKSAIGDSQATLHVLDRKTRLAPQIAQERGWACHGVARLLVLGETRTARRQVARHASVFAAAFPLRGRAVARWLREPTRAGIGGLMFVKAG